MPNLLVTALCVESILTCLHYLSQVYLCCKTLILGDELMPSGRCVHVMVAHGRSPQVLMLKDRPLDILLFLGGKCMVVGTLHLKSVVVTVHCG